MIYGVHTELFLAVGYVVFLSGVAFVLEAVARYSHTRSENYRNAGFSYKQKMDQWECPMGRPLVRSHTDHLQQITYYRAQAHDCNACSVKINCTDSDEGRVLESRLEFWVQSELRRFHRGISISLLVLATIILLAETTRHAEPRELGVIGALLIPLVAAETKLLTSLHSPR